MTSHLSHDTVSAFLAGVLPASEADSVELHLDSCDDCRRLVSEVVRQRRGGTHASLSTTDLVQMGTVLPAAIGDVIDGRYRIVQLLGVGGMGCVFEAHQVHLNQRVALKFILPSMVTESSAVGRFLREARAAARLVTPHVCHVLDLGTLPSGTPFLAMEYLEGETVEQRLVREGPFPVTLAVRAIIEVLEALSEAHGLGIVHRDLKPANLFFARVASGAEVVKVLDFGIAKSVHPDIEHGLATTAASMVLGSPHYMAPEQLQPGTQVDARGDLWSIGCVLYQLLTGQLPFTGQTLVDVMYAIGRHTPDPIRARRPDVSPALESVVMRCLSKSPAQRPESVEVLRAALLEALAAPAEAPTSGVEVRAAVLPTLVPRRRLPWVVAAALCLMMLGATVMLVARSFRPAVILPPPIGPQPAVPVVMRESELPAAPQVVEPELPPPARVEPRGELKAEPKARPRPRAQSKPNNAKVPPAPDELLDERR